MEGKVETAPKGSRAKIVVVPASTISNPEEIISLITNMESSVPGVATGKVEGVFRDLYSVIDDFMTSLSQKPPKVSVGFEQQNPEPSDVTESLLRFKEFDRKLKLLFDNHFNGTVESVNVGDFAHKTRNNLQVLRSALQEFASDGALPCSKNSLMVNIALQVRSGLEEIILYFNEDRANRQEPPKRGGDDGGIAA